MSLEFKNKKNVREIALTLSFLDKKSSLNIKYKSVTKKSREIIPLIKKPCVFKGTTWIKSVNDIFLASFFTSVCIQAKWYDVQSQFNSVHHLLQWSSVSQLFPYLRTVLWSQVNWKMISDVLLLAQLMLRNSSSDWYIRQIRPNCFHSNRLPWYEIRHERNGTMVCKITFVLGIKCIQRWLPIFSKRLRNKWRK